MLGTRCLVCCFVGNHANTVHTWFAWNEPLIKQCYLVTVKQYSLVTQILLGVLFLSTAEKVYKLYCVYQ